MPYRTKSKLQDQKIEQCVVLLMMDDNFKPRGSESKKVAAIKVCKSSIMKKKK